MRGGTPIHSSSSRKDIQIVDVTNVTRIPLSLYGYFVFYNDLSLGKHETNNNNNNKKTEKCLYTRQKL